MKGTFAFFVFLLLFVSFYHGANNQTTSILASEQLATVQLLVSVNTNIETLYGRIVQLFQGEAASYEVAILQLENLTSILTQEVDNVTYELALNKNNTFDANQNYTNAINQLKSLYVNQLELQSELELIISEEKGALQQAINDYSTCKLQNTSLNQVLQSQLLSLNETIAQMCNLTAQLNITNECISDLNGQLLRNNTLLTQLLSSLNSKESSLQALLSQLSDVSDSVKAESQFCVIRRNAILTKQLSTLFDYNRAVLQYNYDNIVLEQVSAACPAAPAACPAKDVANSAVVSDKLILAQANSSYADATTELTNVDTDCTAVLNSLNCELNSTRVASVANQTDVTNLKTAVSAICANISQLNELILFASINKATLEQRITNANLTIQDLQNSIQSIEGQINTTVININNAYWTVTQINNTLNCFNCQLTSNISNFQNVLLPAANYLISNTSYTLQLYLNEKPLLDLAQQSYTSTLLLQEDNLQGLFDSLDRKSVV